jgi:hypothetical protein
VFFYLEADSQFQGVALNRVHLKGRHLIVLNEARILKHAIRQFSRYKGKSRDANWYFLERLANVLFHEIAHLMLGHKGSEEFSSNECTVQLLERKNQKNIQRAMKEQPWNWINQKALKGEGAWKTKRAKLPSVTRWPGQIA